MASSSDAVSLPISEFRKQCLTLLPAMAETGGEIIVTRRGRPVAVVSPVRKWNSGSVFGLYADGDISYSDPTEPYFSNEEWDEIVDSWDSNIT